MSIGTSEVEAIGKALGEASTAQIAMLSALVSALEKQPGIDAQKLLKDTLKAVEEAEPQEAITRHAFGALIIVLKARLERLA